MQKWCYFLQDMGGYKVTLKEFSNILYNYYKNLKILVHIYKPWISMENMLLKVHFLFGNNFNGISRTLPLILVHRHNESLNCVSSSSPVFSKGFCLWEPMTDVILSSNLKKSVLGLFKFYSKSFMIVKYSWVLTQTFPSLCFQNPSKCFSPSLPHIIRNPRRKMCLIETTLEITNVGK